MRLIRTFTLLSIISGFLVFPLPGRDLGIQEGISYVSVDTFQQAFLKWMSRRPKEAGASKMVRLGMPILDVFSADGRAIYHGDDSHENATFLKRFGANRESVQMRGPNEIKLSDWMQMFPQFGGLPAKTDGTQYIVFAVTYPSWDVCQEQNQAVEQVRKSGGKSHARIFEVRLQR